MTKPYLIKQRLNAAGELTPGLVKEIAAEFDVTPRWVRKIAKSDLDPVEGERKAAEVAARKRVKVSSKKELLASRIQALYDALEVIDYSALEEEFETTTRYIKKVEGPIKKKVFAGVKVPITLNQKLCIVDMCKQIGNVYDPVRLEASLDRLTTKQANGLIKNLLHIIKTKRLLQTYFGKVVIQPVLKQVDIQLFKNKVRR